MDSLKKIVFLTVIVILGTLFAMNIYAEGIVNIGTNDKIKSIFTLRSSGGGLLPIIWNLLENIMRFVRFVLNGIALLAMLYVGFLWVTSMGNEEKTTDGKNRIILIVLGLFIINVPDVLYRIFTGNDYKNIGFSRKIGQVEGQLSTGTTSTSISEGSAKQCNFLFCPENPWGMSVDGIISVLEVAMLVFAVVMFTIGGFKMLVGGSEEAADSAKKRIGYGVIALLVTGFLEMIYRAIFFQSFFNSEDGIIKISSNFVGDLMRAITTGAKFFIYFAGPVAIICIIIGGYYFITSAGNEERADRGKKILMYTFFATIMLLLGYTFLIEIVGLTLF